MSGFGERHFSELDGIVPKSLYYHSVEDFVKLLPDNLQLVAADEERVSISFESMREMLSHLRLTGVNGVSSRQTVGITRRLLSEMKHADKLTLTYHPTYFILKKI